MRKRLALLQALAILIAVFQYDTRAAGQEEGRNSHRILNNFFYPYMYLLTARIPLIRSGVDEWLATRNRVRIRLLVYRRYRRMPEWMVLPQILIGILYRKARNICTNKVYLYQLTMKSVVFYTLMEYGALVNEMLLMMSGDIESNPGPSTSLTLKTIFSALCSVSHKWFSIGLELDVAESRLKIIETDGQGVEERMRTMLDYWLNNAAATVPTWNVLVDALKAPTVGESRLAKELEERHCSPEDQSSLSDVQDGANTSKPMRVHISHAGSILGEELTSESVSTSAATQSSSIIPPSHKESEKPPFGCGCGKCTFLTFIIHGCPKPIPSASSFPYLDLSGLAPEEQQILRGKLQSDLIVIVSDFADLVSATLKSLQERCVTVHDIIPHLKAFGIYKPVIQDSDVPVFQKQLKYIEKAEDMSRIFQILHDYMSFFNYHLIEHIIKALGTENDIKRLQSYKTHFQRYAKRSVYECPPQFGPVSEVGHADIFVKVDSVYEIYTVAEIEVFRQKLSELLNVASPSVLRLSLVEKGCFQLTFQVPLFVKEEIFPLSREQERALAAKGVIRLTCGEYQFQKHEPSQPGVDKKSHHDDGDSGVGPSVSTARKSTTVSQDPLDTDLNQLDYELKVQGLVETASNHDHWNGFELHLSVLTGQFEVVKFLVEENDYNPMQRDDQGINAVHVAALTGNLCVFKYFITERNCNPACIGPLGLTPLHLASEQGHLDIVRYLVSELHIEPECKDEYGNTALHRACAGGWQAVVELLAAEFEKYNPIPQIISELTNKWNGTPLHSAVTIGHLNILKFFISDKGCDPGSPLPKPPLNGAAGGTLLHYAADFGHLHIVKYLIDEQGCNPSCLDDLNHTPLHRAAMNGQLDVVKFLTVEKHCDPMCRDSYYQFTPLLHAAYVGRIETVKFLSVEMHCDPMCSDSNQNTPLHFVAQNGHIDVVKFLTLEMHCDPTSRNAHNSTALHLAVIGGHLDIVRFFVSDQNCDPNIPGQYGRPPLHYAAQSGHLHIVKYLTDEQGCNPSCLDDLNHTPLHLAAMKGHMDIVKFLTVEKHCDPMLRNGHNDAPLHLAVLEGHLQVVTYFVEELKCPPDITGQYNLTPLKLAIIKEHPMIAQYLRERSVIPYIFTAIDMIKQLRK